VGSKPTSAMTIVKHFPDGKEKTTLVSDFPSYNKNKNICFNLRTIEVSRLSSPKTFFALNTTSALILTMCIQKTSLTSFL
jgi:hypothetical protein